MTQLILDTGGAEIVLPESIKDGYSAQKEELSVSVTMVTGRMVKEVRGDIWVVTYQYGFFDTETRNAVIAACLKGKREPIRCGFLPPTSEGPLLYSDFFVETIGYPKFMWSRSVTDMDGQEISVPVWANFSVELREVKPSD